MRYCIYKKEKGGKLRFLKSANLSKLEVFTLLLNWTLKLVISENH